MWKRLTDHLSLKLRDLLQSSPPLLPVEEAGGLGDSLKPPAETRQGPGHGPVSPLRVTSMGHKQRHLKFSIFQHFLFNIPQNPAIWGAQGKEQQGPVIHWCLPNKSTPGATAYWSPQGCIRHSGKAQYNPFWLLAIFNSFSKHCRQ